MLCALPAARRSSPAWRPRSSSCGSCYSPPCSRSTAPPRLFAGWRRAPVADPPVGAAVIELPELALRYERLAERFRLAQRFAHARRLGARVVGPVEHLGLQGHRRHRAAELQAPVVGEDEMEQHVALVRG